MNVGYAKRDWVYAGISHPARIVIARAPTGRRLQPGNKVVVVGDEHAAGIGQFLGRLCMDAKVSCRFEWERSTPLEHWVSPDRVEKLKATKPSLVVAVFKPKSEDPQAIAEKIADFSRGLKKIPLVWVLPPDATPSRDALAFALSAVGIPAFHSESIEIHRSPTGAPSARGYAGWAGAVWSWIR